MPESEILQFNTGYYDWAVLRYLLIGENGQVSDGKRGWTYSIDPNEKACNWMHKIIPFDLVL